MLSKCHNSVYNSVMWHLQCYLGFDIYGIQSIAGIAGGEGYILSVTPGFAAFE